ncbi:hypothetical protein HK097_000649 [Rhizophlyctis rosea]|uniref:Uncharacterized protein n=1 Tax=Rhizophlyctis rosea TaxID=64517 RepID=A0AAD5S7U5_9FUNG|nr:hypothetical protein HK097_000649 [Rhizophlyctis rosea]
MPRRAAPPPLAQQRSTNHISAAPSPTTADFLAARSSPTTDKEVAIFRETLRKEMKYFRPQERFVVTAGVNYHILTDKPTNVTPTWSRFGQGVDPTLLTYAERITQSPPQKYDRPATSAQVYGWDVKPLCKENAHLMHRPKRKTEITGYYGGTGRYGATVVRGSRGPVSSASGGGKGGGFSVPRIR